MDSSEGGSYVSSEGDPVYDRDNRCADFRGNFAAGSVCGADLWYDRRGSHRSLDQRRGADDF